ncbi:MAG: hypothetical protein WAO35_10145 [Terriglobia bacterium]
MGRRPFVALTAATANRGLRGREFSWARPEGFSYGHKPKDVPAAQAFSGRPPLAAGLHPSRTRHIAACRRHD